MYKSGKLQIGLATFIFISFGESSSSFGESTIALYRLLSITPLRTSGESVPLSGESITLKSCSVTPL
jgi:hypothetical protein